MRGPVPAGVLAGLLVGDSLDGALLAVVPVFAIVGLAPVLFQLGQPVPACAHIFLAFLCSAVLSGNWLLPQVHLEAAGEGLAPVRTGDEWDPLRSRRPLPPDLLPRGPLPASCILAPWRIFGEFRCGRGLWILGPLTYPSWESSDPRTQQFPLYPHLAPTVARIPRILPGVLLLSFLGMSWPIGHHRSGILPLG